LNKCPGAPIPGLSTCSEGATVFDVEGGGQEEPKALKDSQDKFVEEGKNIRDVWTERIKTTYEMRCGMG
jgi:hypothetical protein